MRITSITVAFNPDPMRLLQQLVALRDQVDEIIIIDNGSVPSVKSRLNQSGIAETLEGAAHIEIIALNENGGIASGFNVGVAAARRQGAEFVLLLDHDSVPAADMVTKLLTGYQQASGESATGGVAAVGPRIVDSRDKHEYPIFVWAGFAINTCVAPITAKNLLLAIF